jgi:hypothetical protein
MHNYEKSSMLMQSFIFIYLFIYLFITLFYRFNKCSLNMKLIKNTILKEQNILSF